MVSGGVHRIVGIWFAVTPINQIKDKLTAVRREKIGRKNVQIEKEGGAIKV